MHYSGGNSVAGPSFPLQRASLFLKLARMVRLNSPVKIIEGIAPAARLSPLFAVIEPFGVVSFIIELH